jgi:tyrosyl-tRNA synthetase
LQKTLAQDITTRVHSKADYEAAVEASQILFGKGTTETLKKLDERMLLNVFKGVPQPEVQRSEFDTGIGLLDFLAAKTGVFKSNGEARRMLKDRAVMINKNRVDENYQLSSNDLLNNRYILVQKGKKNYFLIKIV